VSLRNHHHYQGDGLRNLFPILAMRRGSNKTKIFSKPFTHRQLSRLRV
jgi:hypothetical protein